MKLLITFVFVLGYISSLLSQVSYVVNDTLFPYGYHQTQFYHIFEHDSCFYMEGHAYKASSDKFFLKTDRSGNIIKKRDFPESLINLGGAFFNEVIMTDFGFANASVVFDTSGYSAVLMTLDFNLDTLWVKRYNPLFIDADVKNIYFEDIKQTPDDGYIVVGRFTISPYNSWVYTYPFIVKFDEFGNKQWLKTFRTNKYKNSSFMKVELTDDLGIIVTSAIDHGTIIKMNALGNVQWETSIPNDSVRFWSHNIAKVGADSYVFASPYIIDGTPYAEVYGLYLCKVNSITGQLLWQRKYKPHRTMVDYDDYEILSLQGGKFLIACTASFYHYSWNVPVNRGSVLYFNSNGDSLSAEVYINSMHSIQDNCDLNDLIIAKDGSLVGVGIVDGQNFKGAGWFFKTAHSVLNIDDNPDIIPTLNIYPNPAKDVLNIDFGSRSFETYQLIIYNAVGKELVRAYVKNEKSYKLDVNQYTAGLYIVVIESFDGEFRTKKFIKE